MTREEVIEVLQQDIPCEYDRDLIEALNLAISALSAEGEYIRKKDALDLKQTIYDENGEELEVIKAEYIRELPTVSFPDREKGTDLISRADTLKKICGKKCSCEFAECGFTEPCTYCQIINDMPSADREKGEWIPTSERLPETNKWVLVSVEQSSGNHYVEIMRIDKYKGLWTDNIDYYAEIVKAWQLLPEPYMRGEK